MAIRINLRHIVESLEARRLLATTLLTDIGAGPLHANPRELTVAGDRLYFLVSATSATSSSGSHWQLFKTDGTAEGTTAVEANATPGVASDAPEDDIRVYSGAQNLLAIGRTLWHYEIEHVSALVLEVKLVANYSGGSREIWDLGRVNLSLNQNLHDLRKVDGQLHVYRDGDPFATDEALRESKWWRINSRGQLVATSTTELAAFDDEDTSKKASYASFRGKTYFAHDDGEHGRELWTSDVWSIRGDSLCIYGTSENDVLMLSRAENDLQVAFNTDPTIRLPLSDIAKVRIDVRSGDDRVIVDESGAEFAVPVRIIGGRGNDLLRGGSGRDTIYGCEGNDSLYGGGENDYLWGEEGDDRLVGGGGGKDVLWGGRGRDTFVASLDTERRDARDDEPVV